MPDSLLIPVAKADIGRRLDQLLLVLVVLAIAVAWLAEPGKPLRFIAFAALIGLSWWVPRALNGSRRNTTCNPGNRLRCAFMVTGPCSSSGRPRGRGWLRGRHVPCGWAQCCTLLSIP